MRHVVLKNQLKNLPSKICFFKYLWLLKSRFLHRSVDLKRAVLLPWNSYRVHLGNLIPEVEVRMVFESLVPHELYQVIWNPVKTNIDLNLALARFKIASTLLSPRY